MHYEYKRLLQGYKDARAFLRVSAAYWRVILLHEIFDKSKSGYVARDQLLYALQCRSGYPRGLKSGLMVTSLGDKDQ